MPSPQDLIHVVSTTTGTGDMTVSAVIRNFSDSDAFGTGTTTDVFDYFGWNDDVPGEWERGTGHMSATNTLVRDTIKASSNGGAAVNWSAGTKHFANDVPAGKQLQTSGGTPFVVFTSGQSNMALTKSFSWDVPGNLKVWDFPAATLPTPDDTAVGSSFVAPDGTVSNVGWSFAAQFARDNPTRPVYVINISFSGEPINNWIGSSPSPDIYPCIQANVTAALAVLGVGKVDVMLWWQGESDVSGGTYTSYQANFETLVAKLRLESWFEYNTPIVMFGTTTSLIDASISTNFDAFQNYLQRCVQAEPDNRLFVYPASLPTAYWSGGGDAYVHMTGQGWYLAGKMAYGAYSRGARRTVLRNVAIDQVTGNLGIGRLPHAGYMIALENSFNGFSGITYQNDNTGSSAVAAFAAATNAGSLSFLQTSTAGGGFANLTGSGAGGLILSASNAAGALSFRSGGGGSASERIGVDASGNVTIGTAALATSATDGFLYVPSCAGAPSGTPTGKTGRVPILVDSTNSKLYARVGGAWKSVALA